LLGRPFGAEGLTTCHMGPEAHEASQIFIELGAAIVSLALLGRLASRIGFSSIPLYLLLGLAFGNGGLAPLKVSELFLHESDEILLLTTLGIVILVGGLAERSHESAAIGAFLVGIALSGPIAEKSRRLLGPLRDLFAATFFFFFGLEIDPKALPAVMAVAIALGVCSALTKVFTGYWAGGHAGIDRRGRIRAGMTLVARGEFSIVIAGLGAGISPLLGPVAAAYVLFLAVLGPVLARVSP
jgi:CPA2 family monovalent cation:H+ antiporter-2